MREFDVSIEVSAPPEKVWALVSDLDRMGEWSPECTGVKWKGEAGPKVGNKFKGLNKTEKRGWSSDNKIVTATPNQELAWDTTVMGLPIARWTYRLEPTDGGTRITESWVDKRIAPMRHPFLGNLITGVKDRPGANKSGAEATLARIKAAAEAG